MQHINMKCAEKLLSVCPIRLGHLGEYVFQTLDRIPLKLMDPKLFNCRCQLD